MIDKNLLAGYVVALTECGCFSIKKIDYDENNFGNFCIELVTNTDVGIRFINDRENCWCEAGKNDKWYFIEDVLSIIGIDVSDEKCEISEFLKYMSKLIVENVMEISGLFDDENFEKTQINLEKISTKRALKMFNIK